jgi:acyl-CoA reductase-like NAD-dependent aldehyde dehydrogenase/uncharacterized protein (DUF2141 family)
MIGSSPIECIERARTAQALWASHSVAARVAVLRTLRHQIVAQRAEIVQAIQADTGKPELDALAGDVLVTLEQMRFYEKHAANILRPRKTGKPWLFYPGDSFYEHYEPHGVVLIFAPANYPFQLAVIPLITALVTGNSVILKCSERTPHTARIIASLCLTAGLLQELVQVVHDAPGVASSFIDAKPDLVFFTGSTENGRAVATRAAALLIPTILELGGKDPALVFSDCHLDRTIEGVTYGAFSNAGQVCVGIKRIYVERPLFAEFLPSFLARIQQLRIGSSSDSDLGMASNLPILVEQVTDGLQLGATLHTPEQSQLRGDAPIVLSNVALASRLATEDAFGPVVSVTPFDTEEEAIALANSSRYALSASVWTRDRARGHRIAASLNAGSCAVNDVIRNIANPYASFGGNGHSGHGRYHGPQGLYAFSRTKSIMLTPDKRKHELHWFPFSSTTLRRFDSVLALRHGKGNWLRALRRLFTIAVCVTMLPLCFAQSQQAAHLTIAVNVPARSHGDIAYLIFATPDGFPSDKNRALRHAFVPAPDSANVVNIDAGQLAPGRYAVSVYQDTNGNHKLDSGIFGIPNEPVGASNNPRPGFGPPRFDQCSFQMQDKPISISISLVRPK